MNKQAELFATPTPKLPPPTHRPVVKGEYAMVVGAWCRLYRDATGLEATVTPTIGRAFKLMLKRFAPTELSDMFKTALGDEWFRVNGSVFMILKNPDKYRIKSFPKKTTPKPPEFNPDF